MWCKWWLTKEVSHGVCCDVTEAQNCPIQITFSPQKNEGTRMFSQSTTNKMQRFTIYFCKTLFMFQTVFPPIIRSSKLHIQRQVFDRPILLPAASLARLAAGSSIGLTLYVQFWAPDDGRKNHLKHVERLTEINKLWNFAFCWLYSANILAIHGPVNVEQGCSGSYIARVPILRPNFS